MDPALDLLLRTALALLFLAAAWQKLRAPAGFRTALAGYGLLPQAAAAPAAALVVAGEIAAGTLLLWPAARNAGPFAALLLLALYAGAIGAGLARGRRGIACGCGGPAAQPTLGPGLLARNAVLAAGAALCLIPASPRPLSWLDGPTVAGGVAILAAVYASVNRLLADAGAFARVRAS